MNQVINTIMSRRSTRSYIDKPISDEDLKQIIDCGLYAPSSLNTQNWHFTVVKNKDLQNRINAKVREVLPTIHQERMKARGGENYSIFYDAPVVIFVSGDDTSAALAVENMCIAAESLGLKSCIIGLARLIFTTDEAQKYKDELQIPCDLNTPFAVIFGYSEATPNEAAERLCNTVNFID